MAKITFSSGNVQDAHEVDVSSREHAAAIIWQRFDKEVNPLNAENMDWGNADCVMMLDSDGKVWYCRYIPSIEKVNFAYTDSQLKSEAALLAITGEDRSKMIRRLVKEECEKHGVVWVDDMPKPSRKRKVIAAE